MPPINIVTSIGWSYPCLRWCFGIHCVFAGSVCLLYNRYRHRDQVCGSITHRDMRENNLAVRAKSQQMYACLLVVDAEVRNFIITRLLFERSIPGSAATMIVLRYCDVLTYSVLPTTGFLGCDRCRHRRTRVVSFRCSVTDEVGKEFSDTCTRTE